MTHVRILLLAGACAAIATPALAGDSSDNRRIQNSIYEVASGNYGYRSDPGYRSEPGVMLEGRAATVGPAPNMNEWERRETSTDPEYFRHATDNND